MPIYTFQDEGGRTLDEIVPVGTKTIEVDGVTYLRTNAPQGFALTGVAAGAPSQAEQVRRGYQKLEEAKGSRFLEGSNFTAKQIKKAWGF